MTLPLFQLQHVEVHEAGVLVLLFARELNEAHRLIEPYGRDICIDGKETESRIAVVLIQQHLDGINQLCANMQASVVLGYSEPAYLDTRVTAELLAGGKSFANLLPIAVSHILSANPIIQQTAIRNNLSLILNDRGLCHSLLYGAFGILNKKSVQVIITTIKSGNDVVLSKTNKTHLLQTDFYPFAKCFVVLTDLAAVLCTLLLAHVLNFKAAHLKVESVNTLQNGRVFNRSCHNNSPFSFNSRCKITNIILKKQAKAPKIDNI